mgnify:CR=1 FL=1
MNLNTRAERMRSWLAWALGRMGVSGLYGSPSLYWGLSKRPTLRWCWTGRSEHAAPLTQGDPAP